MPKGIAVAIGIKPVRKPNPLEEDLPEEDYPEGSAEEEAGESPEEEASEYPDFTIPEGLDLSDLKEGDEKEVLATIRKESDDTACITKVEGVDLHGEGPPAPPETAEEGEGLPPETPAPVPATGTQPAAIRDRAMQSGFM